MAPQTAQQNVAPADSRTQPEGASIQPFRMSALHPRAGKASSAGIAPNLFAELQDLFPGSLTSGIGPQVGLLPKAERAMPEPPPGRSPKRERKPQTIQEPKSTPRRLTAEEARAFLLGARAPAGPNAQARPLRTPPIPQSIRDLRVPGFTNVYELLPNEPRLFALESVYGRWDGQVLVLDSAATHVTVVKSRLERIHLRPYCQHETECTYGLARLAFPLATRGILAGNVCGPMLINTNDRQDFFDSLGELRKQFAPIIRFVIKNMPNLKAIVCMGATAHDFVHYALTSKVVKVPSTHEELDERNAIRPVFGGPVVFTTCRTSPRAISRRGGETKAMQDWKAVVDYLNGLERPRSLHQIARSKPARKNRAA